MAKAKALGAELKNPSRHKGRKAPAGTAPLGGPSAHLTLYQKRAFERFRAELPWLKESHRLLVELASLYRGDLLDPEVVVSLAKMQELRRCLAQLGATPADESKVDTGSGEEDDPDEARFQAAAAGGGQGPPPPKPH